MRGRTIGIGVILLLSLLTGPLVAFAQRPGAVARVGMLDAVRGRSNPNYQAFEQALRAFGYVEGQNLVIEFRTAEGKVERLADFAAELVRLGVDLIVAGGPEATLRAAWQATRTLPIVMVAVDYDPMARGYIAGLTRPGGNITGVFLRQIELTSKRLQLLLEIVPQASRIAVLWDVFSADQWKEAEDAGQRLGVYLQSLELHNPPTYDFDSALAAVVQEGAEALFALASPVFFLGRDRIVPLAGQYRLPTMFPARAWVEAGGLMAYGANHADMYRRAAYYADRILKGHTPADLPVEQPTKFELIINLKTAKTLGITVPPSLLLLADEVIQ